MTRREDRLARNETMFREVNERIERVHAESEDSEERIDFLCECGNEDCTDTVSMTVAEYENVRDDSTQFVVIPGHELPEVEHVVDANSRFLIVRKHPEEAAIADETDPRG